MKSNSIDSLVSYVKTAAYAESIVNYITKYAKRSGFILESTSNEADSMLYNNYTTNGVAKLLAEIDSTILPCYTKIAAKQRIISNMIPCEKCPSDTFQVVPIFRVMNTAEVVISDMSSCIVSNDCDDALAKIDMCNIATCECRKLIAETKQPVNDDNPSAENVDIDTIKKRIESISFKELFEDVRNKLTDIKTSFNAVNPNAYNRIIFIKWVEAYSNYLLALKDAICTMLDYYLNILRKVTKSEANMTEYTIENVFDPVVFDHGFAMFEEDLTNSVKAAQEEIKLESSDGVIGKVRKTIAMIVKKVRDFFAQLRAKIVAKYRTKKAEKAMQRVEEMIEENPDILKKKIEYVDYDGLIKDCENARKAIEDRMKAYSKLYGDNKDLLEKDDLTAQESKKVEKIEKQLREIAYGEGKWSKKKIAITVSVAAAAVVVVTGAVLYGKYRSNLNSLDKDLSAVLDNTDTIDNFQKQVGISTRTSGYSVSLAEEYAKVLNTQGKLISNRIVELAKKMTSIASTGSGARTVSNAASAAISAAKYLESSTDYTDTLLMSIYEEMVEESSEDESVEDKETPDTDTDNSQDKNEAPVNKVDDVSEDADDYDPMNGLF